MISKPNVDFIIIRDLDTLNEFSQQIEKIIKMFGENRPEHSLQRFVAELAVNQASPYVCLISEADEFVCMLFAYHSKSSIDYKVGYWKAFRPVVNTVTVTYLGVIGFTSIFLCEKLIKIIKNQVLHGDVDVVIFDHVRIGSLLHSSLNNGFLGLLKDCPKGIETHWYIDVKEAGGIYGRLSTKHRGNIKRAIRKFDESAGVTICLNANNLKELYLKACSVSQLTYQYALGGGVRGDNSTYNLIEVEFKLNYLDLCVIEVNNTPFAFQYGLRCNNIYYLQHIGYDPKCRGDNVGTVLFFKIYKRLEEEGVAIIDFGFGDADYKKSYATHSYEEESIHVCSTRVYPLMLFVTGKFVSLINRTLITLVRRFNLLTFFKKIWRQKLVN